MKGLCKFLIILCSIFDHRILCQSVCQKNNRIIGRSVSIYRDHIICIIYIFTQSFLQCFFCDYCIRSDKRKHRTHIWMDHTGTFCHTTDRYSLSTDFNRNRKFFFCCICSHDCFGCFCTILQRIIFLACQYFNSCC